KPVTPFVPKAAPGLRSAVPGVMQNGEYKKLTTGIQFLREAKKHGLVDNLADRGFKHLKGLYFYRFYG
ncbi:TPA: hypothetical protein LTB79_004984, partial [Escherichia coli]|nr:hypothetical protein [Escherichia coli]